MSKILEDLHPEMYINVVGKDSKRYFTFKLIKCLTKDGVFRFGIWKTEKYVPDMHFYEFYYEFNAEFFVNSSQDKLRKTRICEIFDFTTSKIKFYCGIEE